MPGINAASSGTCFEQVELVSGEGRATLVKPSCPAATGGVTAVDPWTQQP